MTFLNILFDFFRKILWPYFAPVVVVCLIWLENFDYELVFQFYLAVPILLNIYPAIKVLRGDIPVTDFLDLIGYQLLIQITLFVCLFLPPFISNPIALFLLIILFIALIRNILIQIIGKKVECELVYWDSLTWGELGTSCFITISYEYNNVSYEHTEKYWSVPHLHSKITRKILPDKPFHCFSPASIVYNVISIFFCLYIFTSGEAFEVFFFIMFLPWILLFMKISDFFNDSNDDEHII